MDDETFRKLQELTKFLGQDSGLFKWSETTIKTENPSMIKVKFKKLHEDAKLPKRAKPGDAGLDIVCVDNGLYNPEQLQVSYSLGLAMELPPGHVGLLFPRSSIVKTTLTLGNAVGVIDETYRGEMKAVFNCREGNGLRRPYNTVTGEPVGAYKKGDRIVQLVVLPIPEVETEWAEELSETDRGTGGFGSTGK